MLLLLFPALLLVLQGGEVRGSVWTCVKARACGEVESPRLAL